MQRKTRRNAEPSYPQAVQSTIQNANRLLKNENKQTEFDKDVFTNLIEKVIVNSREDITFIFKELLKGRSVDII